MKKNQASVFEIKEQCAKIHTSDLNISTLHPCCQKALACKKVEKQGNCTQKTTKFVKADLKFLEFKKIELPNYSFIEADFHGVKPVVFLSKNPFFTYLQPQTADRAPPQYFGRELLNFIQNYRI